MKTKKMPTFKDEDENKRDVPYQSLLKVFLAERIREELMRGAGSD